MSTRRPAGEARFGVARVLSKAGFCSRSQASVSSAWRAPNQLALRNSIATMWPAMRATQSSTSARQAAVLATHGAYWKCAASSLPASRNGASATRKRRQISSTISAGRSAR